jgi:hypothetical protein
MDRSLPAIPEDNNNSNYARINNPVQSFRRFLADSESDDPSGNTQQYQSDVISIASSQDSSEDDNEDANEDEDKDEEASEEAEDDDIQQQPIRQPKAVYIEKARKRPGPKPKSSKRVKHQDNVATSDSDSDSHDPRMCGGFYFYCPLGSTHLY